MKHSPTPWQVDGHMFVIHIRDSRRVAVAHILSPHVPPQDDINAAHIVKCVNAYTDLVEALYRLSMIGLQSDAYRQDAEFRDAVDSGISLTQTEILGPKSKEAK